MILADAALTPTDLTGALMVAVAGLCTVVGVLFWQLLASKGETFAAKNETLALAKEMIPVSTALLDATKAFQKIVERREEQQS